MDKEWQTIRSFFTNTKKLQNLVKYSEKLIFDRNIQPLYFKKSAKIYQTVILEFENSNKKIESGEKFEKEISDLIEEFIIYTFQLEDDISGIDHLEVLDEIEDCDNNTIAEVPEEYEDSKANTAKFEVENKIKISFFKIRESRRGSDINVDFVNVMSNSSSDRNFEGGKSQKKLIKGKEDSDLSDQKFKKNGDITKITESSNLGNLPMKKIQDRNKYKNRGKSAEKSQETSDYETNPRDKRAMVKPHKPPKAQMANLTTPKKEDFYDNKSTKKKKKVGKIKDVDYNSILEGKHNKLMKSKQNARLKMMNEIISQSKSKEKSGEENPFKLDKKEDDFQTLKFLDYGDDGEKISPPKFKNVEVSSSIKHQGEKLNKEKKKKKSGKKKVKNKRKGKKYSPERDIELELKYPSLAKALKTNGNLGTKIKSPLYENIKNLELDLEKPLIETPRDPNTDDKAQVLLETERSIQEVITKIEEPEIMKNDDSEEKGKKYEEKLRASILEELNRETSMKEKNLISPVSNNPKKKDSNSKTNSSVSSKRHKESKESKKLKKKKEGTKKRDTKNERGSAISQKYSSRSYTSNSTVKTFRGKRSPLSTKIPQKSPITPLIKPIDTTEYTSLETNKGDFYHSNPRVQLIDVSPNSAKNNNLQIKKITPLGKINQNKWKKRHSLQPKITKKFKEESHTKADVIKDKVTIVDKLLESGRRKKRKKVFKEERERESSDPKKNELRQRIEDSVERLSKPKNVVIQKKNTPILKNMRYSIRNSNSSGFNSLAGSYSSRKYRSSRAKEREVNPIAYIEKKFLEVKKEIKEVKNFEEKIEVEMKNKRRRIPSNSSEDSLDKFRKEELKIEFKVKETSKLEIKRKEKHEEKKKKKDNKDEESKRKEREDYIQNILDKIEHGIEFSHLKKKPVESNLLKKSPENPNNSRILKESKKEEDLPNPVSERRRSNSNRKKEKKLIFRRTNITKNSKNPAPFNTEQNSEHSCSRVEESEEPDLKLKIKSEPVRKMEDNKSDFSFDDIEVIKKTEKKEVWGSSVGEPKTKENQEVQKIITSERNKIVEEMNKRFIEEMRKFRQKR